MRNLIYLNGDGMVNVPPKIGTVQINDEYYCEMSEVNLHDYLTKNDLHVSGMGKITDNEDGYIYGTVLILSK